jgi:hypothetical protein
MISPIIICNGVIRSGSTWSFNVGRLLGELLARRRGHDFQSVYLEAQGLDQFLLNKALLQSGVGVIKGHAVGPVALDWIRTGKAKAICTYRDPRDCVASDLRFWGKGFEASLERVALSFRMLPIYNDFGRTLFVRYEEMMLDRLWQIRRIAAYVEVALDPKEAEWIDSTTNMQSSKKIADELPNRREGFDTVTDERRRDRMTLLHANHIGSGRVGRWRQDLTAGQGQLVTQKFQGILQVLGYETGESINRMYPGMLMPEQGGINSNWIAPSQG